MKLLNNFLKKKNNFLYFLILCFIFVVSSAYSIKNIDISLYNNISVKKTPPVLNSPETPETKTFPQNPVLGAETSYPILSAQGVLALDLDSGVTLYEKDSDMPLLPASTTKIITALVALDTYKLDQVLTVPDDITVDGQKIGLYPGEQMTFENLLQGLLIYSANDAAETLAKDYCAPRNLGEVGPMCGYDAFIAAMNNKAKYLSMTNSHFENPVGLDGDGQRSTAKDLVRASEVAMKNPVFAKTVGTKEVVISDATGKTSYDIKNVNKLLGTIPGVLGIKTGWTEAARENLVTYIVRDGHKVIIAILGSQDRFGETKELIDWIFSNYNWEQVKFP